MSITFNYFIGEESYSETFNGVDDFKAWKNENGEDITSGEVIGVADKDTDEMFLGMQELTTLDVSKFDTSRSTNMSKMFGLPKLTSLVLGGQFTTSNVTDMSYMFKGTIDGWHTIYLLVVMVELYRLAAQKIVDEHGQMGDDEAQTYTWALFEVTTIISLLTSEFLAHAPEVVYPGEEELFAQRYLEFEQFQNNTNNWMTEWCQARGYESVDEINLLPNAERFALIFAMYEDYLVEMFQPLKIWFRRIVFQEGSMLQDIDLSLLDTSKVVTMEGMFESTSMKEIDLRSFNMPKLQSTKNMFRNSQVQTILVNPNSNFGNVTNMEHMFQNVKSDTEELNINNFDFSSCNNCRLFFGGSNIKTLYVQNLKFSGASEVDYLFANNENLETIYIDGTNLNGLTSMKGWFANDLHLKLISDGTGLDTSSVTNMSELFAAASSSIQFSSGKLDTSAVTDMSYMFKEGQCSLFNRIATNPLWDSRNVVTMEGMFQNAYVNSSLNFSRFDTSNVTNMSHMFEYNKISEYYDYQTQTTKRYSYHDYMTSPSSLTMPTASSGFKFDTSKVTDMSYMFAGRYIETYTSSDLFNILNTSPNIFSVNNVINAEGMFYGSDKAYIAFQYLNYTLNFENLENAKKMFAYSETNSTKSNFNMTGWHMEFSNSLTNISGMFKGSPYVKSITFPNSFDTSNVTDMSYLFSDCLSLQTITFNGNWDFSNITSMDHMFCGYDLDTAEYKDDPTITRANYQGFDLVKEGSLTSLDMSSWNLGEISDISYLCCNQTHLTQLDITSIQPEHIEKMNRAFYRVPAPIVWGQGNFDNIKDISYLYTNHTLDYIDINRFANAPLENIEGLFADCIYEGESIADMGWQVLDISRITNISNLFRNCTSIKYADLSAWDLSNIENVEGLFQGCTSLESVNLSNYTSENSTNFNHLFEDCNSLQTVTLDSNFNSENVTELKYTFAGTSPTFFNTYQEIFNVPNAIDITGMLAKTIFTEDFSLSAPAATIVEKLFEEATFNKDISMYEEQLAEVKAIMERDELDYNLAAKWFNETELNLGVKLNLTFGTLENNNLIFSKIKGHYLDLREVNPSIFYSIYNLFNGSSIDILNCDQWDLSNFILLTTGASGYYIIDYESTIDCAIFTNWTINNELSSLAYVFGSAGSKHLILDGMNTENILSLRHAFDSCKCEYISIKGWDTSNVDDFSYMFYWAQKLINIDLSEMNTSKSVNYSYMFDAAGVIESTRGTADLSNFNFSKNPEVKSMIQYSRFYHIRLNNWDFNGIEEKTQGSNETYSFFADCYCREIEMENFNWGDKAVALRRVFWLTDYIERVYGSWIGENIVLISELFYRGSMHLKLTDEPWATLTNLEVIDGIIGEYGYSTLEPTIEALDFHATYPNLKYFECINKNGRWAVIDSDNFNFAINAPNLVATYNLFNGCKQEEIDMSGCVMPKLADVTGMFINCSNLTTVKLPQMHPEEIYIEYWPYFVSKSSGIASVSYPEEPITRYPSFASWFQNCSKLENIDLSQVEAQYVTNISSMCFGCKSLPSTDIGCTSYPSVTNADHLFALCNSLEVADLSNWEFDSLTRLYYTFYNCQNIASIDFTNLQIPNVTVLDSVFSNCESITTASFAFIDMSSVTTIKNLFSNCSGLVSVDFSSLQADNLVSFTGIFQGCQNLTTANLSSLNLPKLVDISSLFSNCYKLENVNLQELNAEKLVDMSSMFYNCESLTSINSSNWNLPKIENMASLFSGCDGLTEINLDNLIAPSLKKINCLAAYCNNLQSFSMKNAQLDSLKYFAINTYEEQYPGEGPLYNSYQKLQSIDLSGCTFDSLKAFDFFTASYLYRSTTLTTINMSNIDAPEVINLSSLFSQMSHITTIDMSNSNYPKVTNISYMFSGCSALSNLNMSNVAFGEITNISGLFRNCTNLTDISVEWLDTSKVANFNEVFSGCTGLTSIDLTALNMESATSVSQMFSNCTSLTSVDLRNITFSNLTTFGGMFNGCSSLTSILATGLKLPEMSTFDLYNGTGVQAIDLSGIVMPKVWHLTLANMPSLKTCTFGDCQLSNLQSLDSCFLNDTSLESFSCNTLFPSLSQTQYMFKGCTSLKTATIGFIDFSRGGIYKNMFEDCTSLTSVDFSDNYFTIENDYSGLSFDNMFNNCTSLTTVIPKVLPQLSFKKGITYSCTGMYKNCENLTSGSFPLRFNNNGNFYGKFSSANMYENCKSLQSFESWNPLFGGATVCLTSVTGMFKNCESLTSIDMSNWVTSYNISQTASYIISDITEMFYNCKNLTSLNLLNWYKSSSVTKMGDAFSGCSNLQSIQAKAKTSKAINNTMEYKGNNLWRTKPFTTNTSTSTTFIITVPQGSSKNVTFYYNGDYSTSGIFQTIITLDGVTKANSTSLYGQKSFSAILTPGDHTLVASTKFINTTSYFGTYYMSITLPSSGVTWRLSGAEVFQGCESLVGTHIDPVTHQTTTTPYNHDQIGPDMANSVTGYYSYDGTYLTVLFNGTEYSTVKFNGVEYDTIKFNGVEIG